MALDYSWAEMGWNKRQANVRHNRQQKRCDEGALLLLSELMALLYPLFVQGRVARCSYPSSDAGLNPLNSHLGNLRDPS